MRYEQVCEAVFLDRPNRFVANVVLHEETITVHVKNTGRCRELLVPGARVVLTPGTTEGRKTPYDLIAVYKDGKRLFNIDSQAPNQVVGEWLQLQPFTEVRREVSVGRSRIDFAMKKGSESFLLEVKGCTLEKNGIGWFPDAPTERGVKHLRELAEAAAGGINCAVAFVMQAEGLREVHPNRETHPEFADALEEAAEAGVRVLYLPCRVKPDSLEILDLAENRIL